MSNLERSDAGEASSTDPVSNDVKEAVVSNAERYAPHLSEFYPIVNRSSHPSGTSDVVQDSSDGKNDMVDNYISATHLHHSGIYRNSRRPSSIRSGTSTISDLRTLVTKKDMEDTSNAMIELLKNSKDYAISLRLVSQRASMMAHSLEKLARLKGCNDATAEKLLSASGLFHLTANHEQILSQTLDSVLGEGLKENVTSFKIKSKTLENKFKQDCKEQSMKLKLQERQNVELSKRKVRNLLVYRESLANLQDQIDKLEALRRDFYQDSYMTVESTCDEVLKDVASVSRAHVEISENIARKGWSGGGLDDLLFNADDPFSKETDAVIVNEEEDEVEEERETDVDASMHDTVPGQAPELLVEQEDNDNSEFENSFSLPSSANHPQAQI